MGKYRILIADDCAEMIPAITEHLGTNGYDGTQFLGCCSGEEAIEKIEQLDLEGRLPDLLIIDNLMYKIVDGEKIFGMRGSEACRELRRRGYDFKILGQSGMSESKEAYEDAGADAFLTKGQLLKELVPTVDNLLGRY